MIGEIVATGASIIGLVATLKWATERDSHVEKCIHAMYADMYNKDKYGDPAATFTKCMSVNYSSEFNSIKKIYELSSAASAANASNIRVAPSNTSS